MKNVIHSIYSLKYGMLAAVLCCLFFIGLLYPASGYAARKQTKSTQNTSAQKKTASPRPIRYVTMNGRKYVNMRDVAAYYKLTFAFNKKGAVFYGNNTRVEFVYNKRAGVINKVNVTYLFPMIVKNGTGYLSEIDFQTVLQPVLQKKLQKRHPLKTIMIDPGHGGSDPGAKGPVKSEKQVNLEISKKLQKALEALGFEVIMTRTGDTFPSLQDRSKLCQKIKPDLYISIHCNSSENKTVKGIETFLMTPCGAPSSSDSKPQLIKTEVNEFDQNSYRLAYEVQKALIKNFPGTSDRGVKHARFYVLKNATCPAILIETGFISNPQEGKEMASDLYQVKVMDAILNGMAEYLSTIKRD